MLSCFLQIPVLSLEHHGGARVLVDLANAAAGQGARVRFLVPKGGIVKKYAWHAGVEVKEIGWQFKGRGGKYLGQLLFLFLSPFYMKQGILISNFFPVVYSVWLAQLLFGRPSVYLVQDIETWFRGPLGALLNTACRLTWRSAKLVATSPFVANSLSQQGRKPWMQIQIGVSEDFFKEPERVTEKSFDLVCFPRRETWKRLDRVQNIVAAYRKKFGPLRVLCLSQDQALLDECSDWGQGLKPKHEEELIGALDSARILLFTSEREGLGLPPLEGMARGLPCLVFDNEGAEAYLSDGLGGFLIPSNQEALAVDQLHEFLQNTELYARQSAAAREKAALFRTSSGFQCLFDTFKSAS